MSGFCKSLKLNTTIFKENRSIDNSLCVQRNINKIREEEDI